MLERLKKTTLFNTIGCNSAESEMSTLHKFEPLIIDFLR